MNRKIFTDLSRLLGGTKRADKMSYEDESGYRRKLLQNKKKKSGFPGAAQSHLHVSVIDK